MTTTEIHNGMDFIDSRSIIDRIDELEGDGVVADDEADEDTETTAEMLELTALKALTEEAEGYCPDWKHGATLIRDSYFEAYAEEFASDIGAIDRNATWPLFHIDWKAAAEDLQQDYTQLDFDGVAYWVR